MDLRDVPRGRGLFAAVRRRGRPALVLANGPGWSTALSLRLRQARIGSLLAFLRDGASVVSGVWRKLWRSPIVQRTVWLRRLELAWHASGAANTWSVTLTWDFAQLVYGREESQLALAHVHLARVRREAADRAAALWVERRQKRASMQALSGAAWREAALELLRATAELDAVTGGLYRDLVGREEAELTGEGP